MIDRWRKPALTALGVLLGLLLASCAPKSAPSSGSGVAPEVGDPVAQPSTARVPEPQEAAPQAPLTALIGASRLTLDLVSVGHLAVRTRRGRLSLDMGQPVVLGHTLGGWRTGWDPTPRQDGETRYLEVNRGTARLFFMHEQDGVAEVVLRGRGVNGANPTTVTLNGAPLGEFKLGSEWSVHRVKVGPNVVRDGENRLTMKFKRSARIEGRAQYAHIDGVALLPSGDGDAEGGGEVDDGALWEAAAEPVMTFSPAGDGDSRRVMRVGAGESWRFEVAVPTAESDWPRLGARFAALGEGARLSVTVVSDERPLATLRSDEAVAVGRWQEAVWDLSAWSGRVVSLRLTNQGSEAVAVGAGVYEPPVSWTKPSGERARHVLVYLVDTLRYDKLGLYNDKVSVPTPNFDAFAAEATVFEAAYDTENWTKPSTASVLTGLYPWRHKTKDGDSKLPDKVPLLSEILQGHGMKTAAFIANGYVSRTFGFGRGWDAYTNYIREHKVTDAGKLVDDALAWMDKQGGAPSLVYLHTIDPHVPYSAPWPWKLSRWEALKRGEYKGPLRAQNTGTQIADMKTGKLKPDRDDRDFFQALYDAEVAYNDHEFGRLLEGLREREILDDTLIIVVADHGEEFWDHGSLGHGHSLYDEMVHTPLIVRHPGTMPQGVRLPHVVSTTSIVPTVLEALGKPALPNLDGASLLAMGQGSEAPVPRAALTDFMYRQKSIRVGPVHWLTNGQGGGQLFHLLDDRGEARDLTRSHPIALAYARAHFGHLRGAADHSAYWRSTSTESSAPQVKEEPRAEQAEVDDTLREQLEAMGYIEGATGEHAPEEDKRMRDEEDDAPAQRP